MENSNERVFTPHDRDGNRLRMVLSDDDMRKIGRGRPASLTP